MKKILVGLFFFVPLISFALNAPSGDPWYVSTISIDQASLPVGVSWNASTSKIINSTSTPLILVDNIPPYTGSCVDGELCYKTPMVFPPELPSQYLSQYSGHKTVFKFQDGKTYIWVQDPNWAWKIPVASASSYPRSENTFDTELKSEITENIVYGYGFVPVGEFPYVGFPGKAIGPGQVGYMGYKRPENVTVPAPQKFSINMYYDQKEIKVTGVISYVLKQDYRAPDWTWSTGSESGNGSPRTFSDLLYLSVTGKILKFTLAIVFVAIIIVIIRYIKRRSGTIS